MKDFPVTYSLTDEQVRALEALTARSNEQYNAERTAEEFFQIIMTAGSESVINEKLRTTGQLLGRAE